MKKLLLPLLGSLLVLGCTKTNTVTKEVPGPAGGGSGGSSNVCAFGSVPNAAGVCEAATSAVIIQSDGTNSIEVDDASTKDAFYVYSYPVGSSAKTFTAVAVDGKKFSKWTGACA